MKFGNIELAPEEERLINEIGWEKFERSVRANTTYCRLMNSYAKNLQGTEHDYPQYYGGAYVGEDGSLVVAVTENVDKCKEDLVLRIDDSMVRYQLVPFSYNFLQDVNNSIQNFVNLNEDNEIRRNIKAWGIRQKMNKVIVYMEDTNDERIKEFKEKVTPSDAVHFMSMSGHFIADADTVSIDAGNPIVNGSVAYRATNSRNTRGVVTAAHVVQSGAYLQTLDGTNFARCIMRNFQRKADAAFCEITDENFVPSRNIYGVSGAILNNNIMDPLEGAYVFKVGKTTGLSSGPVIDTNFSCEYKGETFQNLTAADYRRAKGDSGGIVYFISSSTRYISGVHCAGYDNGAPENQDITAVYSKASIINSLFNIYGY